MTACRSSHLVARFFALLLLASPALAQYDGSGPEVQPNNYPPALPARRGPGPMLVFTRLGEITLPGPLGGRSGFLSDGLVVLPVEAGWVRVAPETDATPSVLSELEAPPPTEWVVSADGKRRYRTTLEGLVDAQRRSHVRRSKWVKSWTIVAPNSIIAPPILIGPRLCYAGLDDRVTCVRASNGHRIWAVDLGDRLSSGITCWPACGTGPIDGEILLVVPDDGATVIALDAYDGRRVASFELPATQRFASPALVVSGERIAIARKGYDAKEAALVLLSLVPPAPSPVPYNDGPPAQTEPSGR